MPRDALLFTHLLLTFASIVVGKAARDAIFLRSFTPLHVIAGDLGTLAAVAILVGLQLRLKGDRWVRRLVMFAPLGLAVGDAALWLGVSVLGPKWVAWTIYLWVGVQASIVAPHASVLAAHVLAARPARQTCGSLGGGSIAGWIVGGLIADMVASQFGAVSLLLVSAALIAPCPIVVALAWPAGRTTRKGMSRGPVAGSLRPKALRPWHSPHFRWMAALGFISAAVTTIAGLQFKVIASESIEGADHLAALFGSLSFHAGLLALATQVVFTPRVIRRFGLSPALTIAPVAIAAGFVGVWWSGTLAAAVFLKGSDQVLRYSVDRAATELLYRPLPSRDVLDGKTFVDGIVSRSGDAAGATLALFAAAVLHIGFASLGVLALPLIVAWLVSARAAERAYRARLLEDLRQETPPPAHTQVGAGGATVSGILDPDPATRLRVLRALSAASRPLTRRAECLLDTALTAESVGFAILVDSVSTPGSSCAAHRDTGDEAIERICRLLLLRSPDQYPDSLARALRSGDLASKARAHAYLDTALAAPHRQFLMSLLDRWSVAAASTGVPTASRVFRPAVFNVTRVWALLSNRSLKGVAL
jgi:ATP:ADP antiporter, AAA family